MQQKMILIGSVIDLDTHNTNTRGVPGFPPVLTDLRLVTGGDRRARGRGFESPQALSACKLVFRP